MPKEKSAPAPGERVPSVRENCLEKKESALTKGAGSISRNIGGGTSKKQKTPFGLEASGKSEGLSRLHGGRGFGSFWA
jgi:hypothetical protein